MDCLSAQRSFQQGDKAPSPETESGSNVTDSAPVRAAGAEELLLRVK